MNKKQKSKVNLQAFIFSNENVKKLYNKQLASKMANRNDNEKEEFPNYFYIK